MNTSEKLDIVINSLTKTEIISKGERFLKYALFRSFRIAWEDED